MKKQQHNSVEDLILDVLLSETGSGKKRGERGLGSKSLALLEKAATIVATHEPITVRGVCYKLFVQGAIASMAKNETQKVSRLLVYAREHGIVEWSAIVDESRQMERPTSFRDLAQYAKAIEFSFRRDYWATQPFCVQVWSEKSTVGGILRPVTEEYGVPFMSVHGFGSATVVRDIAETSAADSRELVILYCGDHDPSGRHMSDVDLPNRMERYGGRATIRRIALLSEDLPGLPSFQAKPKDPRNGWYRSRFGKDAWELDAMDPNVLRARIEDTIKE